MTPFEWPASLPKLLRDPYSVAPRPGNLQLDVGVQTSFARIYSQSNDAIQCEALLSSTQEPIFRDFFRSTLSMGTQWFMVPLLRNGAVSLHEALFIGPPPSYRPANKYGHVIATFSLLTRGEPLPEPVYELTASQAVNIAATAFSTTGGIGGTIVTINTLANDRLVISKPSIASDPALNWDAWSNFNNDGANGGLAWLNLFRVSDQDDTVLQLFNPGTYASAALALAGLQALMPVTLTGSTQYQFWSSDPVIADNRGGLSLRVETYSRVS